MVTCFLQVVHKIHILEFIVSVHKRLSVKTSCPHQSSKLKKTSSASLWMVIYFYLLWKVNWNKYWSLIFIILRLPLLNVGVTHAVLNVCAKLSVLILLLNNLEHVCMFRALLPIFCCNQRLNIFILCYWFVIFIILFIIFLFL